MIKSYILNCLLLKSLLILLWFDSSLIEKISESKALEISEVTTDSHLALCYSRNNRR